MNHADQKLLIDLQTFLFEKIMHDATATAHHTEAGRLYARVQLHAKRPRPALAHFMVWRESSENSVRENPKAEVMVYQGLYPGRVTDLLLELLT